eukprot:scaffold21014_cov74-Skeletonema_menzelii.AAC.1
MGWNCWTAVEVQTASNLFIKISSLTGAAGPWEYLEEHRHNHRVSEKRRHGFTRIGHFDTWLIDELQSLVYKNRRFFLFPH